MRVESNSAMWLGLVSPSNIRPNYTSVVVAEYGALGKTVGTCELQKDTICNITLGTNKNQ